MSEIKTTNLIIEERIRQIMFRGFMRPRTVAQVLRKAFLNDVKDIVTGGRTDMVLPNRLLFKAMQVVLQKRRHG